jgi:copper chaperone
LTLHNPIPTQLQEKAMIELTLPDMTCGHCVKTVTATVSRVDPAATLAIDLPTHVVRIGSNLPPERWVAVLTEEGYPPAPH